MEYTALLQLVEEIEEAVASGRHIEDEQVSALSAFYTVLQEYSSPDTFVIEEGVYVDQAEEEHPLLTLVEDPTQLDVDGSTDIESLCEVVREFITNTERETIIALLETADEEEDYGF